MDTCFANAAYASRATNHSMLNMSHGALDFQRDMVFNITCIVALLHHYRQQQINVDENI